MHAYYNEIDAFACAWMRAAMERDLISRGIVVEEDIRKLSLVPEMGDSQFHAFAGIGIWSYALRMAGWPDEVPVWTGSCPCQPFSQAGRRKGISDDRHLWPDWFKQISTCRPAVVFGEQVASPDGLAWFDAVSSDLEGAGYTVEAFDLCAAGFGAPHLRQRLYFVALADVQRCKGIGLQLRQRQARQSVPEIGRRGETRVMGDSCREGSGRHAGAILEAQGEGSGIRLEARNFAHFPELAGATRGFWSGADLIACRDQKWRPVESGSFPLAHGSRSRVGRLRAHGNQIVPQVASGFVEAVISYLVSLV